MVAVNVHGTDPNKGGGDWLTAESDSIFMIEESQVVPGDDMHLLVTAIVQSSTEHDQVGKKIKEERISVTKAVGRLLEFCCAIGIYSKPQWEKDVAAGVNPDLPLEDCVGRMFATPVRHKKWDESRDPQYWQNRIKDAPVKFAGDPEKLQKEIERCELRLREKKGNLQVGGPSGFTFWAIGDAEADHIPMLPQDMAMWPNGLPTKAGVLRKRGTPSLPPAQSPASRRGTSAPAQPAAQTRPAASAPASGVGAGFF